MRVSSILALGASLILAAAQEQTYLGFNSGATDDKGENKKQSDFEKEFEVAQQLKNSPGLFNSVRLYTNIKPDTTDDPIEAFPAAIKFSTRLLLGIWTSGTKSIDNELKALEKAIDQYGKNFTDLVVGISVGSEDLYRNGEDGVRNKAGIGQDTDTIISFIKDTRDALKGTTLSKIPVGHVDTWSAWANKSNSEVIKEVDFLGTNLFPYYEYDKGNDFSNVTNVFEYALSATEKAAGNKEVWITETGWPASGPDSGKAKATLDNAKGYWDTIGCTLFGRKNVWYYVLRDSNPENKAKFAVTDNLSTTPMWNFTCPADSGAPASINNNTSAASMVSTSWMALSLVVVAVAWAL